MRVLVLILMLALSGGGAALTQTDGAATYAAFTAWRATITADTSWNDLLAQYEAKLRRDGASALEAARRIRVIASYDEGGFYDDIYARAPTFNTAPNAFLADVTRGRPTGRALDVGMGMGRNALFLARAGWDVTGFDVAAVGVRQAMAVARSERLPLTGVVAADDEFDFGESRWDLIAIIYAIEKRSVRRVGAALRPGGLVVIEAGINADPAATFGFAPGELPRLFKGFTILRHEETEGAYDWGPERIKLVRFAAQKPAR